MPGGGVRAAECSGGAGCDRREDGDPDRAADLVAGRVEAGDHSGFVLAGAGQDCDRDGDDGDSEPEAGDEHPGEDVAEVGAVLADVGEESHSGGGDQECRGERHADAVAPDDVGGGVGAEPGREGERDEGEAGHQRVRAEHVLQVERAEEEEAEDRAGRDEHQEQAAADGAVGESLDPQQGLLGPAFPGCEAAEPHEAKRCEPDRLGRAPAGVVCLGDRVDERGEAGGSEQRRPAGRGRASAAWRRRAG